MEPNFFWRTNHRIKKYINGLRIEVPSFYFTFNVDKFPLSFTVSEILFDWKGPKNANFKTLTHLNFLIKNLVLNIKLTLFYCNIEMYHIPANINLR